MESSKVKSVEYPIIKLLLVGDSGVGKSSILMRFADDKFADTFISTIGIDFKAKVIQINGVDVKLQIWDTAGQERFKTITKAYFRNAMGVILVYDISNEKSFSHVSDWLQMVEENTPGSTNQTTPKPVIKMLVGNKCDLERDRAVSKERAMNLAREKNLLFFETSAKLGMSSDESFTSVKDVVITLAKKIFEEQRELVTLPLADGSRGVNLQGQKTARTEKQPCCRN